MTPDRPEALRVALEVIGLLDRLGIRYHLGGSYASSIHGIPRQTQDIDLVVDVDEISVAEFVAGLPDGYYRELAATSGKRCRVAPQRRGPRSLRRGASARDPGAGSGASPSPLALVLKAQPSMRLARVRPRLICGLCAAGLAAVGPLPAVAVSPSPAVAAWPAAATQTVEPSVLETGFYDVITVDVFTVVARIVDASGKPRPGIGPGDLIATIGGRELPVAAVDWHGATPGGSAEPYAMRHGLETRRPPAPAIPDRVATAGRSVVIFLQNDFEPSRVAGQMKLFPGLRRLVDNLGPADRVAVMSFYAHLKLWQDFTTDKAAVKASLQRAFFPGARPGRIEPGEPPSLLQAFDEREARGVATSVAALRYTAEALASLPGEKDIIFFGYGFEGDRLQPMLRALQSARATTFIIDTTQADWHTLGVTLETTARATGGTYATSADFAGLALARVEHLLAGHYVITIDRSDAAEARGKLHLRLRDGRGTVLMAPSRLR